MPPAAMHAAAAAAAGVRPNFKYTQGVRNVAAPMAATPTPVMAQPPQPQPAVFIQGQEPLTASMLAQAPPSEQKQMLGERLFPLIQGLFPDMAGKSLECCLKLTTPNWCICWNTRNPCHPRLRRPLLYSQLTKQPLNKITNKQKYDW